MNYRCINAKKGQSHILKKDNLLMLKQAKIEGTLGFEIAQNFTCNYFPYFLHQIKGWQGESFDHSTEII